MDLSSAIIFAIHAHRGQEYAQEEFILHPFRVMLDVDPKFRVVAVLHDCKEDAGVLPEQLLDDWELEALNLLTRDESLGYRQYIVRIGRAPGFAGQAARAVKLADLKTNMHFSDNERLVRKGYKNAFDYLVSMRDLGKDTTDYEAKLQ